MATVVPLTIREVLLIKGSSNIFTFWPKERVKLFLSPVQSLLFSRLSAKIVSDTTETHVYFLLKRRHLCFIRRAQSGESIQSLGWGGLGVGLNAAILSHMENERAFGFARHEKKCLRKMTFT